MTARPRRVLPDLALSCAGRPAVVMGGGPSLPWGFVPQLTGIAPPADAVLISANAHGCRLAAAGLSRMPDWIVCIDDVEPLLRPWGVPVIADKAWADVLVFHRSISLSGVQAAFVAWALGCSPIWLLGMDLYEGGTYFDAPEAESPGRDTPVGYQLGCWARLPELAPGGRWRAPAGSALAGVFGAIDPFEPIGPPPPLDHVLARTRGARVRMLRDHPDPPRGHLHAGAVVEVDRSMRNMLVRRRIALDA